MVTVMIMVRVSFRVNVMILFCKSIALFSVFYAFRIYIPHSAIPHYTRHTSWRNAEKSHQISRNVQRGLMGYFNMRIL